MTQEQTEQLVIVGLRNTVLDIDEADKEGLPLDLETIKQARDILSGVLDRHKEEIAA